MLRACRRVLRPSSKLGFFVITLTDGLSPSDRERAVDAGPEYAAAGPGYPALLEAAGFTDVSVVDVTAEYGATLATWIAAWDDESAEIERAVGAAEFADRQAGMRRSLDAAQEGLLVRLHVSAA